MEKQNESGFHGIKFTIPNDLTEEQREPLEAFVKWIETEKGATTKAVFSAILGQKGENNES